mmetsp:Transcript_21474/g.54028  ORF Transcript_21474/g.54028 Transcript_21474/m.54028 type:complete len:279 (+) Transcript_21474:1690-2526(+)
MGCAFRVRRNGVLARAGFFAADFGRFLAVSVCARFFAALPPRRVHARPVLAPFRAHASGLQPARRGGGRRRGSTTSAGVVALILLVDLPHWGVQRPPDGKRERLVRFRHLPAERAVSPREPGLLRAAGGGRTGTSSQWSSIPIKSKSPCLGRVGGCGAAEDESISRVGAVPPRHGGSVAEFRARLRRPVRAFRGRAPPYHDEPSRLRLEPVRSRGACAGVGWSPDGGLRLVHREDTGGPKRRHRLGHREHDRKHLRPHRAVLLPDDLRLRRRGEPAGC